MASGTWCAVLQPNLFPRLSTLAKLHAADVWVVLADVQFTRGAYQQRCRLAATRDPTCAAGATTYLCGTVAEIERLVAGLTGGAANA